MLRKIFGNQKLRAQKRSKIAASLANKWSKNFDEMPHYHLITPCDGEWIRPTLTPCKIMVPWAHSSQPPNGISIRSAFFAVLNCWWTWPTDPQTHTKRDRQTDRARYSVCSNSPHLKPRPHQRQCRQKRNRRHCCQKHNVAGFGDNVAVYGDIVAGVDGALSNACDAT